MPADVSRKEGATDPLALELKEACRTTGARWSAVLEMSGNVWKLKTSSGLVRAHQAELKSFLQLPDMNAWLCGAVSVGRYRWRTIPAGKTSLPGKRMYLYPSQDCPAAILTGADELHGAEAAVWRVLAGSLKAKLASASEIQPPAASAGRSSARQLQLIQQIQTCLIKRTSTAVKVEEAARLIAGYYPEGVVQLHVKYKSERAAALFGETDNPAILILSPLVRAKVTFGGLAISLPAERRVSRSDYTLVDIIAGILSVELALALHIEP